MSSGSRRSREAGEGSVSAEEHMTMPAPVPPPVVYARAVSFLNSRTVILNSIALLSIVLPILYQILTAEEVRAVIPARFMPLIQAVLAGANIVLRFATVRPIAVIAPGQVKVVEIPKLNPPAPPTVTD